MWPRPLIAIGVFIVLAATASAQSSAINVFGATPFTETPVAPVAPVNLYHTPTPVPLAAPAAPAGSAVCRSGTCTRRAVTRVWQREERPRRLVLRYWRR